MIFHHCYCGLFFIFFANVEVNFLAFHQIRHQSVKYYYKTSYVGPFWVLGAVKETITLATEQGAMKQRILWRREDRNSCFLTEEAQMEAQVLLSAAITAARAVAQRRGWKGCCPAARTNSDTDYTVTCTSLFRQCWRRVEMRARPLNQPTRAKLTY